MGVAVKRQGGDLTTGTIPTIPTVGSFSGTTAVVTNAANSETLAFDTAATTGPGTTLTVTSAPNTDATSTDSSSSGSSTPSSATKSSIPIGTVIGVCVGVFVGLSTVLLLILWYGRRTRQRSQKRGFPSRKDSDSRSPKFDNRNDRQNAERRKSGRELWVKMEDKEDDGYEKYAMKRTSALPPRGGEDDARSDTRTVVERSVTIRSAKSAKTTKSIGYGVGLGLAETFRTPEVPPQLQFTDSELGSGRSGIAPRGQEQVMSWGGETAADGSFLSLKRASGAMSPSMVMSYQTPPATATEADAHRWEEAEVVSPDREDDAYGGLEERHPYAYPTSDARRSDETVRKSQSRSQSQSQSRNPFSNNNSHTLNPFGDAAEVTDRPPPPSAGSTVSFYSTQTSPSPQALTFAQHQHQAHQAQQLAHAHSHHHREESDPEREARAMQSLIAALNISRDEAEVRLSTAQQPTPRASAQSAVSFATFESHYSSTTANTLDEAGFERFPLPPTDIEHHQSSP